MPLPSTNNVGFYTGKKVLVTGGLGFIGTNLVLKLDSLPVSKIVVLDNLFTGQRRNLNLFSSKCTFVEGCVEDYRLLLDLVKQVNVVFHLAARNIIVSTKNPSADFDTNARGTFNLLEACRQAGSVERVVYTSSASVYGNPTHLPVSENDAVYALNPYAASKASGESYCQAYFETYQVPTVIVRYSNVYGVHQSPAQPYSGVISKFIFSALRGDSLTIHGDGEQTRDYTFVDDTVLATVHAAWSPQAIGGTFNVGTGVEVSVNQLAHIIREAVAAEMGTSPVGLVHVERRDIDNVRRRVMSIEQARRVLRWFPSFTLREGICRTIRWVKGEGLACQDSAEPQEN